MQTSCCLCKINRQIFCAVEVKYQEAFKLLCTKLVMGVFICCCLCAPAVCLKADVALECRNLFAAFGTSRAFCLHTLH